MLADLLRFNKLTTAHGPGRHRDAELMQPLGDFLREPTASAPPSATGTSCR
jgi:hypothetical protein